MTSSASDILALFTPRGRRDPYPIYARLRASAPVTPTPFGGWMVFPHDEIDRILRSPSFRAPRGYRDADDPAGPPRFNPQGRLTLHRRHWVLFESGTAHARLRRLLMTAFTSRAVQQLEPRIERLVESLLAEPLRSGELEVIAQLAYPLPATVICELLGIPEHDRERNRAWAAQVSATIDPSCTDVQIATAEQAMDAWDDYVRAVLAKRRADPGAGLIDAMLAAESEGDRLNDDEIAANITLLFMAGHETTTGLIGNGLYALLAHPAQLRRLRDDIGRLDHAVEEMLRYDSPVQFAARVSTEDVELGGQRIPAGVPVSLALGAANRDPARHIDPEIFDIGRDNPRPLSFGAGAHFCVGAALARMETRLALRHLIERTSAIALQGEPEHRPVLTLRGYQALHVTLA